MIIWTLIVMSISLACVLSIDDDDTDDHWDTFKEKYNKTYNSTEEEQGARDNFVKNMLKVALCNMDDDAGFVKAVHQYSDMSEEDQIDTLCGLDMPEDYVHVPTDNSSISERDLPAEVDWVKAGYVSPVKDQLSCGSCWAFSAIQALESQFAIQQQAPFNVRTLSPQQLVDCDTNNSGCDGGWPQTALTYTRNNKVVDESGRPYVGKKNRCRSLRNSNGVSNTGGYANVASNDAAVAQALADHGPLTCAIYVSPDMMHYDSGIYKEKNAGQEVNHGVLLVGYATENGQDYWIIKNSWGPTWGEDGFIRVARTPEDEMSVTKYTSYPQM